MQKNKKLRKSMIYRAFNQERSYSKRDLNPHSRNGQRILSPSCLPFHHSSILKREKRAENETRTRDPNLGKVMLYQLSYFRKLNFVIQKSERWVPRTGLEPACLSTHAPETCASTIPPPGHSVNTLAHPQDFIYVSGKRDSNSRP
mgnify:CR=1 FL=1